MKKITQRLKEYREKEELTQEYMADLLGITTGHYSYLENGKRNPGHKVRERIERILG